MGRIGKCIFLQLMSEKVCRVRAINIPGFNVKDIKQYLEYDSVHHPARNWKIEIIDDTKFSVDRGLGKMIINVLNSRDATKLNWQQYDIDYVIDTTGAFLTRESCEKHNVNYVIMCAPPKDNTDQFVYNVNHLSYKGERFVSNASCTTNCLSPVLRVLEDSFGVEKAAFTTIHSTTASQTTVDTNQFKNRTSRSILNNIIPHSTGANKSVTRLIPSLAGKVVGTSLRVPVNNVSVVDLVVTLKPPPQVDGEERKKYTIEEVMTKLDESGFVQICKKKLVSTDYMTTTCPSIVDYHASMTLCGENEFKLMIWYDNEWSYCTQVIKLGMYMAKFNSDNGNKNAYFIENHATNCFKDRRVVIRVDWNVPVGEGGEIQDDYRITSSLKTIKHVLNDGPAKVILISHLGRPDSKTPSQDWHKSPYSWSHYLLQLQKHFENEKIHFLSKGLCEETLQELNSSNDRIFLLENIRFHKEETAFAKMTEEALHNNEPVRVFNALGEDYVNDAFGCCHRSHLSIVGFDGQPSIHHHKAFGYLIEKEVRCLESIAMNKNNDRILAIVGGGKMKDKLELLTNLSKKVDGIYIAGGNVNSIYFDKDYSEYLGNLRKNRAEIHLMSDGLAAADLASTPTYMRATEPNNMPAVVAGSTPLPRNDSEGEVGPAFKERSKQFFFDIGMESIIELNELIQRHDTIFWNGTLGVVENKLYSYGSTTLMHLLMKSGKKVIIGGGDTASFAHHFQHNFHFVSTGGGASIDYISNGNLSGLKYFQDK